MRRFPPAFVVSLLLHVGLLLLAYISWEHAPKPVVVVSVPVQLIAKVPSRAQAEAPVDKLAVKAPQPIPAPEEKPQPTPPTPAPPLPVPTPQKEVVPQKTPTPKPVPTPKPPEPKPVPKPPEPKQEPKPTPKPPEPKPVDKAPPDKNGMKKPVPAEKPKPSPSKAADDFLSNLAAQTAATPSKATTRTLAQANTHRTQGASNIGQAENDAGNDVAMSRLTTKLMHLWQLNCDVWGAKKVAFDLVFVISPNGRVISGPQWVDPNSDPIWEAAAASAKAAVKRGELYDDLPKGLYNQSLDITFDVQKACRGQ